MHFSNTMWVAEIEIVEKQKGCPRGTVSFIRDYTARSWSRAVYQSRPVASHTWSTPTPSAEAEHSWSPARATLPSSGYSRQARPLRAFPHHPTSPLPLLRLMASPGSSYRAPSVEAACWRLAFLPRGYRWLRPPPSCSRACGFRKVHEHTEQCHHRRQSCGDGSFPRTWAAYRWISACFPVQGGERGVCAVAVASVAPPA